MDGETPRRQRRKMLVVLSLLAAIAAGTIALAAPKALHWYRLRRAIAICEAKMAPLGANPIFQRYVRRLWKQKNRQGVPFDDREFGRAIGRAAVARGLPRLSDQDLETMHALKVKMLLGSPAACACFWDADACFETEVNEGLLYLTTSEMETWGELAARAALAEAKAPEPFPSTDADFERGMRALLAQLPPAQVQQLQYRLTERLLSRADQCLMSKTAFIGADSLAPEMRIPFKRALANRGPKDLPAVQSSPAREVLTRCNDEQAQVLLISTIGRDQPWPGSHLRTVGGHSLYLSDELIVTHDDLTAASLVREGDRLSVELELTAEAAAKVAKATRDNLGQWLVSEINDEILVSKIASAITSDRLILYVSQDTRPSAVCRWAPRGN